MGYELFNIAFPLLNPKSNKLMATSEDDANNKKNDYVKDNAAKEEEGDGGYDMYDDLLWWGLNLLDLSIVSFDDCLVVHGIVFICKLHLNQTVINDKLGFFWKSKIHFI